MRIQSSLFESDDLCLAPIDYDQDPEIESRWTHDASYLRMLSLDLARPLSPSQIKKKYEAIEKEAEEKGNLFYFTIRERADDRLVGFAKLFWIEWNSGAGMILIGIGSPQDRSKGYGTQTLGLMLRYAFNELNLHRLTAIIPEYNQAALHLFEKAGFNQEVRRRQAVNRDGRRWDLIHLGILRNEWKNHLETE